jgi:hypothetical protein
LQSNPKFCVPSWFSTSKASKFYINEIHSTVQNSTWCTVKLVSFILMKYTQLCRTVHDVQ